MDGQINKLERAITNAERVTYDQLFTDRRCYCRRGTLPWSYDRDYLKVVAELENLGLGRRLRGVVVTAFPVEAIPRREVRTW